MTREVTEEASPEPGKRSWLVTFLPHSERVVYYGTALALLVTVGMLFVSVRTILLAIFETGPLETALTILARVLFFVFVE